jgi:hypothetical protein
MASETKLDLYREHKAEYAAPRKPALVDTGPAKYLAIDGKGAPGSSSFQEAIGSLYAVAFTIKMTRKFAGKGDYKVCNLEGLYSSNIPGEFMPLKPGDWKWTLLIRIPDLISEVDLRTAVEALIKKGKDPGVKRVEIREINEGQCVQMLHVGPYSEEERSISAMKAYAAEHNLKFSGAHHEIYLSDPRRVEPARLRTILRVPVNG